MKWHKVSWLPVMGLVVLILASACGNGANGPFVITDEGFAASDICDGEGTVENRMVNGELEATVADDIPFTGGMFSAWCNGLTHVWLGTATHEGYTFESDPDDPLQFVVDRESGYRYVRGTGTVSTPDGDVVTLGR